MSLFRVRANGKVALSRVRRCAPRQTVAGRCSVYVRQIPKKGATDAENRLTLVRFLIIKSINFMRGTLTLLKGLPRYDVFLEEAKHFPGLDASACYTFLQLLRTGDELLALDQQVLASHGTRHGRFNLLMMLMKCSEGQATPAGLAAKTGVTRATISGLLDGLQKDGLIERRADPEDRRLIRVHLTAAGQNFLDKIRPAYSRWFSSIVEPLNEQERQQLVFLLEKIRTRLGELARNGKSPST
jgi:DNA-binding MarR family transcriptional regulator